MDRRVVQDGELAPTDAGVGGELDRQCSPFLASATSSRGHRLAQRPDLVVRGALVARNEVDRAVALLDDRRVADAVPPDGAQIDDLRLEQVVTLTECPDQGPSRPPDVSALGLRRREIHGSCRCDRRRSRCRTPPNTGRK